MPAAPAILPRDPAARLATLRARLSAAARAAGRDPAAVTLIAAAKTQDVADILPLIAAGQRVFGESRVQEAQGKWPALKAAYPDLELHMIGPLQTNKVRDALHLFDVIESVDRPRLARKIAAEAGALGRRPRVFVQVNTGEEPQKAGVAPAEADALVALCRDGLGLIVEGLMCIPPQGEEPALHFALLRELAARNGLSGLSMGMSADFEVAIAFGATHIRIGTALFGPGPM